MDASGTAILILGPEEKLPGYVGATGGGTTGQEDGQANGKTGQAGGGTRSADEQVSSETTGQADGTERNAIEEIVLPATSVLPEKPKWSTLLVSAGKKDKVNKVDIVGFLTNKGQLKKEDIGLIEVKDFFSFVAVRKSRVGNTLQLIKNQRIKNKKVKIDMAK